MKTLVLAVNGRSCRLFYQLCCGNQIAQRIRFNGEGLTFSGLKSKTKGSTFKKPITVLWKPKRLRVLLAIAETGRWPSSRQVPQGSDINAPSLASLLSHVRAIWGQILSVSPANFSCPISETRAHHQKVQNNYLLKPIITQKPAEGSQIRPGSFAPPKCLLPRVKHPSKSRIKEG